MKSLKTIIACTCVLFIDDNKYIKKGMWHAWKDSNTSPIRLNRGITSPLHEKDNLSVVSTFFVRHTHDIHKPLCNFFPARVFT